MCLPVQSRITDLGAFKVFLVTQFNLLGSSLNTGIMTNQMIEFYLALSYAFFLRKYVYTIICLCYSTCDRMSTTLVQFADTSCKLMIIPMKAGKSGKRRLKKKEKALQMPYAVANTCMFRWEYSFMDSYMYL